VKLYPGQVKVSVFHRNGTTGEYRPQPDRERHAILRTSDQHSDGSTAVRQERRWEIQPNGNAHVTIALRDLVTRGAVALAASGHGRKSGTVLLWLSATEQQLAELGGVVMLADLAARVQDLPYVERRLE
jgi:hypothetical protein